MTSPYCCWQSNICTTAKKLFDF